MEKIRLWTAVMVMLGVLFLTTCRSQPPDVTTVTVTRVVVETVVVEEVVTDRTTATAVPTLSPTRIPPDSQELIVCSVHEPDTLYPYAASSPIETAVLHAIYENDFTTLAYDYQAQGIEKLPDLADGDAFWQPVTVQAGDLVVDTRGNIVPLSEGTAVIDAEGDEVTFAGDPVEMSQLVADFTLRPRVWSDDTPVTAVDSVFSFNLAADPETPADKLSIARTASYRAINERTVRWVGLPGWRDRRYFTNFWRPLPRHLWNGYEPGELPEAALTSRTPVGDGPFQLVEWVDESYIRLEPNPYYYRREAGLPRLDAVTFRFVVDVDTLMAGLLDGSCHVGLPADLDVVQAPLLAAAEKNGLLHPYFQPGRVYEHIDFGVDSWGRYGDGIGRPDWFEDVRVRQAMAMCTDRQRMVDEILHGHSVVMYSYIPREHPLYSDDLSSWLHDPAAANQLLDEVGYLDGDGDGVREDPGTGAPFRVTLGTTTNEMQQQVTRLFQQDMRTCGIAIDLYYQPADEWYADGPEGMLFGRRYDLGEFAWEAGIEPACFLYTADEITGPAGTVNPETERPFGGWTGANNTGWWHPQFDVACTAALEAMPGTAVYVDQHQRALRIFAQNLPVIPLFQRLRVAATHPSVRNFHLDPTQLSPLWNLNEIEIRP